MKRRSFIQNTALTLGALAFLNSKTMAAFLSDPTYKIKMLNDNVGVFTEKGGTILFMLTKDGPVVIDAQFPDSAQHLIDEIKKKTTQPFQLLINTHHHGDHTAGNIAFKDLVPHVLAHENSRTNQKNAAAKNNNEDKQLYPDRTYTDLWSEKIGKEEFALHYFGAGHTNGDSLVHLRHSNIVHMGDLVFNRKHPYIDRSAGANISSWIKVLEKATSTFSKKTTYICGHAGEGHDIVINAGDLNAFRDYLGNLLKFVNGEIIAGKSKEEILKTTSIPGSPDWVGEGIDRPLNAAYAELTAE
ncbi:MAG: MBL fold metallo-hydrolase [Ferruginibacter sp.]